MMPRDILPRHFADHDDRRARDLPDRDVLLVDDLVNRAILVHVREGARVVKVGKRGGCKSTPQAFIERLMIAEARSGHTVVRLKGGDPFMFGRGGEPFKPCFRR